MSQLKPYQQPVLIALCWCTLMVSCSPESTSVSGANLCKLIPYAGCGVAGGAGTGFKKKRISVRKVQDPAAANNPYRVEEVILDPPTVSLAQFEPKKVTVLLKLANGETVELLNQSKISWEIEDESVASIFNNTVKGEALGQTRIKAKVTDKSSTLTVNVSDNPQADSGKEVETIRVSTNSLKLDTGQSTQINATAVIKGGVTSKNLIYSTDRQDIVQINQATGEILKKKPGNATVTVVSALDARQRQSISISDATPNQLQTSVETINGLGTNDFVSYEVRSVNLFPRTATLEPNETIKLGTLVELKSGVTPHSSESFTWESDDPEIVTVENQNTLKALKSGTTIVRAISTLNPDKVGVASITVESSTSGALVKSVKNLSDFNRLNIGESQPLLAEVQLNNNTVIDVAQWHSSDESVALIQNEDTLLGVGTGTATITVSPLYGGTQEDSFTVTVGQDGGVDWVSISPSGSLQLNLFQTQMLQATVALTNGSTSTDVTWESKNPEIANVSSTGELTARRAGQTTITARSTQEPSKFASLLVSIKQNSIASK